MFTNEIFKKVFDRYKQIERAFFRADKNEGKAN